MQIDGIKGNVTATGHEGWIELTSFVSGVGRNISGTSPGKQSNRESAAPSFSEISVTKDTDETSPLLFAEACVGKSKTVTIHFCETGDTALLTYLEFDLSDVLISGFSVNAGGSGHPSESLSLNFSKIIMKYTPFDDTHTAGSPIPAGYDLALGTKI